MEVCVEGQGTGMEAEKRVRLLGMWVKLGWDADLLIPPALSTGSVLFKQQTLV